MIPIAPDSTALESYVNVLQHLGGVRGCLLQRNCIIWRAKKVSKEIFGDALNLFQVLMKFTALPLVVETLHEPAKREMFELISSEGKDAEVAKLLKRLMPKNSSRNRRCPCCISEDLRDYGIPFGRIVHQFAVIYTCPKHDILLEEECPACGAGFELLPRTAPFKGEFQVCSRCKSTNGRALSHSYSDGYVALAKLLSRGLEGAATEVGPLQMKIALDRFADLTLEHDIDLLSIFAEFWARRDWRDACKDAGANSKEVRNALLFGVSPACVITNYVLASFFNVRIVDDVDFPSGPASRVSAWKFKYGFPEHPSIRCRAHEFGMPMRVIYTVLVGDWLAVRDLGYAIKNVRQFVATLESWQQLAIHARRAIFLGDRLSRLNINSGKVARPREILVKSAPSCTVAERVRYVCELLDFSCEVEVRFDVPRESPAVFCDGVEMNLRGSTRTYDFVIQRTQYWPKVKRLRFFMIPHVPSWASAQAPTAIHRRVNNPIVLSR